MLKQMLRRRFFRRELARGRSRRIDSSNWTSAGIPFGERLRVVYVHADQDGRHWWVVEWTGLAWDVIERCVLLTVAQTIAAEAESKASAETIDLGD